MQLVEDGYETITGGYLRDVVMLWVFKGCGYVMGI